MALRFLMISGTGVPPFFRPYYQPILDVAEEFVDKADFESIFLLGLGDIRVSAKRIGKKYLKNTDDQYIICGHSQGAILASLLAIKYPDKVVAVIAEAGPFKGTAWTDPLNMPIRGVVEAIIQVSSGKIRPRPALRRFIVPLTPIVRDLAAHSEVCEEITTYLETQVAGHDTYAFIGSGDMFVFPHRSANPTGPKVTNYIVAPQDEYQKILPALPDGLVHIDTHAGHISIVYSEPVLAVIRQIIKNYSKTLAQS